MPHPPRVLRPWSGVREFFGAEVRHWRMAKGLTQDEVGRLVHLSGDSIAKIEKAERWPPPGFAAACDQVLSTGGVLARLSPLLDHQKAQHRTRPERDATAPLPGNAESATVDADQLPWEADTDASPLVSAQEPSGTIMVRLGPDGQVFAMIGRRTFLVSGLAGAVLPSPATSARPWPEVSSLAETARVRWPGTRVRRSARSSTKGDADLLLPGGAVLDGATLPVRLAGACRSASDQVVLADVATGPHARLIVAGLETDDAVRFFASDVSTSRTDAHTGVGSAWRIPQAYELDDLTYAALWASTNLERALLEDDAALDEAYRSMRPKGWAGAEATRDQTTGLTPASQMWLGSSFCAQHILHHLSERPAPPVFWTREQRGEEASTWLLFRHKQDYLRAISDRYRRAGPEAAVRIFCIPEDAVTRTRRPERILLLLAVAQMEAHGIHVVVTVDPAYVDNPGFLLGGGGGALVASWVREASAWHVDPSPGTAHARDFADAVGHSLSVSILCAPTSLARLEQLAHYLGLDWRWLRRRASQLTIAGWGGLIRPRSRLLSAVGLDIACRQLSTA